MHNKRLWSEGLGRFVRVKVLARVLRTIDKCGGLDGYLLGEKAGRVKELGVEGWRLRWMVMRTGRVRRRVRAVKEGMGLLGGGEKTAIQEEGRRGETVEDQVGIASSDIIDRIENAKAASFSEAETGTTLDPRPSSAPTSLQSHIAHTTFAIEAATARLSQPHSAEGTVPTDTTPSRRYTKSEKRAWRALRSTPAISPHSHNNNSAEPTPDEASLLLAEADRIETLVESEIMGMGAEERERVEVGMEMLRSGVQELEMRTGRVGKGMLGMGKEREKEGGGIVGRIKGFFSRRR